MKLPQKMICWCENWDVVAVLYHCSTGTLMTHGYHKTKSNDFLLYCTSVRKTIRNVEKTIRTLEQCTCL